MSLLLASLIPENSCSSVMAVITTRRSRRIRSLTMGFSAHFSTLVTCAGIVTWCRSRTARNRILSRSLVQYKIRKTTPLIAPAEVTAVEAEGRSSSR